MSVVASETIGTMHIQSVNPTGSDHIAKPLKGWTDEGCPTVAVLHKFLLSCQRFSHRSNLCTQICYLAFHGFGFGLLLGRDTSVESHLYVVHWALLSAL